MKLYAIIILHVSCLYGSLAHGNPRLSIEQCRDLHNQSYADIRDLSRTLTELPFANACRSDIKEPPAVESRTLIQKFYELLLDQIQGDLLSMQDFTSKLQSCIDLSLAQNECPPTQAEYLTNLYDSWEEARILAGILNAMDDRFGDVLPNSFVAKPVLWDEFRGEELDKLRDRRKSELKDYRNDFEKVWNSAPKGELCGFDDYLQLNCRSNDPMVKNALWNEFKNSKDDENRTVILGLYQEIMANNLVLQLVHGSRPSLEEVNQVSKETSRRLTSELALMRKIKRQLHDSKKTKDPLHTQAYSLLDYTSQLERVLIDHPEYCRLVAALLVQRKGQYAQTQNVAGFLLLGASLIAPPVGVLGGVGFWAASVYEYRKKVDKQLLMPFRSEKEAIVSPAEVKDAWNEVVTATAAGVLGPQVSLLGVKALGAGFQFMKAGPMRQKAVDAILNTYLMRQKFGEKCQGQALQDQLCKK